MHFGRPLAPFALHFGSLWLSFGSLLALFGSLWLPFWLPLAAFGVPFAAFVGTPWLLVGFLGVVLGTA